MFSARYREQVSFNDWHLLAVRHWRKVGDEGKTASALNNVAMIALDISDFPRAQQLLEESLALKRKLGNPRSVALSLANLADVYLKTGRAARAADVLAEAEAINAGLGDFQLTGTIACNQGDLARARSDLTSAARHYRRALECFRASGNMPLCLDSMHRKCYKRQIP